MDLTEGTQALISVFLLNVLYEKLMQSFQGHPRDPYFLPVSHLSVWTSTQFWAIFILCHEHAECRLILIIKSPSGEEPLD